MATFQTVKGFRDFFPEDCALRNYVFTQWRAVAARYGFVEYEGALLEPTALYKKKSGDEIVGQLFHFEDKGGRDIALRPEVTPSLARMAAAGQRNYTKPLKWFQIGSCFRYEEPQRGRQREFVQFNVDILGEIAEAADAELVAMAIDLMRSLGFTKEDFTIRLSNRTLWTQFLEAKQIAAENGGTFLQIIDKMERLPENVTDERLKAIGLDLATVKAFISSVDENSEAFAALRQSLSARGLWEFVKIDPGIVRGLAYYTGTVFEVFDLKHNLRAVAGGGRYDNLVSLLSDGGADLPACGFAMGDVVLSELIKLTPPALEAAKKWGAAQIDLDAYVIVADEERRADALKIVQHLREADWRVDYPLTPSKMRKQLDAANNLKARFAVIVGQEWPNVVVKDMSSRNQMEAPCESLVTKLKELKDAPSYTKLIAQETVDDPSKDPTASPC